jgi:hypothetical protein
MPHVIGQPLLKGVVTVAHCDILPLASNPGDFFLFRDLTMKLKGEQPETLEKSPEHSPKMAMRLQGRRNIFMRHLVYFEIGMSLRFRCVRKE